MLLLEYVLRQRLMRTVNCEDAVIPGSWKNNLVLQKHRLTRLRVSCHYLNHCIKDGRLGILPKICKGCT